MLGSSVFANWTMEAFTNTQAWGTSITATGTVREHTQVITHYEGTNDPAVWTNLYWRFDSGAVSNDYLETDGLTYTNLIVDVGVQDRTNTFLLRGRDVAMWELYLSQLERSTVVGDAPISPAFYWHTDYILNLQARKDWIEANAENWVCTTNADTNGVFDAYFEANTNATTFPAWDVTNLLAYVGAPTNWLDYTPTWPTPRLSTNTVVLSGTNNVVTNSFWFGSLYTNLVGTNGQIVSIVLTNDAIADGFDGSDYQKHDLVREAMDKFIWSSAELVQLYAGESDVWHIPGFLDDYPDHAYLGGGLDETWQQTLCVGDVWTNWTFEYWEDNYSYVYMPSAMATWSGPTNRSPTVYALRQYTTNTCSGFDGVGFVTFLACENPEQYEVVTSWDACTTDRPWTNYDLEIETVTCAPDAITNCNDVVYFEVYSSFYSSTSSCERASAYGWADVNQFFFGCSDSFYIGGYAGPPGGGAALLGAGETSYCYTNFPGVPFSGLIVGTNIIAQWDGCNPDKPWTNYFEYGVTDYDGVVSTNFFGPWDEACYDVYDVPVTNYSTTNLDVNCLSDDTLSAVRNNRHFAWLYPLNTNIQLSSYDEYVVGTPEYGSLWVQESFLPDTISTNCLALYRGQTNMIVYPDSTNSWLVTTNFVAPLSFVSEAPFYSFQVNTTKHWNVTSAAMLYKWQFNYGPTNTP